MKSWYAIAEAIFKANMISLTAHRVGMQVDPIMGMGPDGHMMIALEQKHIVAGWEV